mmetsp:Transcript_26522/g.53852  ORF Transcript_26522/g.53852 Transcript_26522/m.53852 type:complete len:369 (+) Transcript_26522:411-1517(+)
MCAEQDRQNIILKLLARRPALLRTHTLRHALHDATHISLESAYYIPVGSLVAESVAAAVGAEVLVGSSSGAPAVGTRVTEAVGSAVSALVSVRSPPLRSPARICCTQQLSPGYPAPLAKQLYWHHFASLQSGSCLQRFLYANCQLSHSLPPTFTIHQLFSSVQIVHDGAVGAAEGFLVGDFVGFFVGGVVGFFVGAAEGFGVGLGVGALVLVGFFVGFLVGLRVGLRVGSAVGSGDGNGVGGLVAFFVGFLVGRGVGAGEGSDVGLLVGDAVGLLVGDLVGFAVGFTVGVFVVGLFVGLPGSTVGNIVGVALGLAVVGREVGLRDGDGVGMAVVGTVSTITPPTRADVGAIVGTSSSPGAPLGLLSWF